MGRASWRVGWIDGGNGLQRSLLYQFGHGEAVSLERIVNEVRLAEELGLESVWCLPEAGEGGEFSLGAAGIWLAALVAQTHRIRVGWGLAGMMPPRRPPIRSAEQGACLDLASGGRLDLALLPSVEVRERGEQGSRSEILPRWDEGVRMIVEMWDRKPFSWTSERFHVPPIEVLPKPSQSPHPPIWLVGWGVEDARRAGRAGLGFLDASGGGDEILEMHRDCYVASRSEADPGELVCTSAYAAVIGFESGADTVGRLMRWQALGFDQAILQIDPIAEATDTVKDRIRLLANETDEVH